MRRSLVILSMPVAGCGSKSADQPTPVDDAGAEVPARATYRDPLERVGTLLATDTNLEILEVTAQANGRLVYCTNVRGMQIVDSRDPASPTSGPST